MRHAQLPALPDNALLISAASFEQAGGLSRLDAEEEFEIGDDVRLPPFSRGNQWPNTNR